MKPVCLLLLRALISSRMQSLWLVAPKRVCSAKCILFVWVCMHHGACVCDVRRWAGVRTGPRWQRGSRARRASGRSGGAVEECLACCLHTRAGWHYSGPWLRTTISTTASRGDRHTHTALGFPRGRGSPKEQDGGERGEDEAHRPLLAVVWSGTCWICISRIVISAVGL